MKGKKIISAVLACALSATCVASLAACNPAEDNGGTHTPVVMDAAKTKIVVQGYEWGPAVPKIIVEFKGNVSGVTKDTFAVTMKGGYSNTNRTITDAYTCDENGNKVTTASKYVAIEMSVKYGEASPFNYDQNKQVNVWNDSIPVTVKVNKNSKIKVGDTEYLDGDKFEYTVTAADRKVPQTATWNKDTYTLKQEGKNDIELSRASWKPQGAENDNQKNPLVIWLHGGGEGGTDIDIALLGNEVTALTSDNSTNVQHYFKTGGSAGAYVLAVQSPTMWMDSLGNGDYGDNSANGNATGEAQTSYYTEALWQAINDYVDNNDDIDKDRIYIGGCSNGGYMTMNLALEHGDYFAAYYPICQGYMNGNINEERLNKLKDLNIWFLLSEADNTLKPEKYTIPLYYRLLQAGAENIHLTYKKNVTGVDDPNPSSGWGTPGYYDGHWSWIYAFNDDVKTEIDNEQVTSQEDLTPEKCTKEGNMWEWIASVGVKQAEPVETYEFEAENAKITNGSKVVPKQDKIDWSQAQNPAYWEEFYKNPDNYTMEEVKPTVETHNKYTGTDTKGEEVTNVGYFTADSKLAWKIEAAEECDVVITLHAAGAVQDQTGITDWNTGAGLKFKEVDLSKNEYIKLVVNSADAVLTGTLPGIDGLNWEAIKNPDIYCNFGTGATQTVHLKKGSNVIELLAVNKDIGLNIDKIVISGTTVKLSYAPANNTDRIPPVQGQPQG